MNMTITIKDNEKKTKTNLKLQVKTATEISKIYSAARKYAFFGNFISFVIKIIFLWCFLYEFLSFIFKT